ncbi:hypothetical protein CROQUDRAFT_36479 [Cronartium quercuum f. sp. fusiforme G11]|uniref:UBA domain-containing protein n=1 Tax=Cronartium quercuum f. sp. fusiforme G11 TaxID=708437 RepID=A0A9P6NWA8_9BASI|nr:hypothetical protein CROQUDRAFT_36479 [Cronartium quercuum f. sp. fusiforme G11]
MLKRHQAIIDLSKNALIIQGRELRFLNEHELPESAKDESDQLEQAKEQSLIEDNSQRVIADAANRAAGAVPLPSGSGSSETLSAEEKAKVDVLVGLGATSEQALVLLRSTNGNVEYAASLLFNQ